MSLQDLYELPTFGDGWSYLYVDHCDIQQNQLSISIHDQHGTTSVPCANLAVLMLGPGVSITHADINVLADVGCLVVWVGEQGVKFYSVGMGETRNSGNLLHQAAMWANEESRLKVIKLLYDRRFAEELCGDLTLEQIRGMEGIRMRKAYATAAETYGVKWSGRQYQRTNWNDTDPVNQALSTANASLYGICHAAIVSAGFSPAIGFIHTGKMLSFVYDIADIYKAEITIPLAFRIAAEETNDLSRKVRLACRDIFRSNRLIARIIPDIKKVLMVPVNTSATKESYDSDPAKPGTLWDPKQKKLEGGKQYGKKIIESEQ